MTRFFVLYNSGGDWTAVGDYDGTDGEDANGLAAIDTNKNGKYASFVVDDAVVTQTVITPSAQSDTVPFD